MFEPGTKTVSRWPVRCLLAHPSEGVVKELDSAFCREGFAFDAVSSGAELIQRIRDDRPDIVLIDASLPDMTGQRASRLVRDESEAYIVLITDAADEVDRIVALSTTVDDCVTSSTSTPELVARARAMLRRPRSLGEASGAVPPTIYGPLTVDYGHRAARVHDNVVPLTPLEFELLSSLARADGAPVSRRDLMHAAWGQTQGISSHSVDSHMHNLRRKLRESDHSLEILTVRGVGFRLCVID
jgi:DNA-binding response OmpR family regulator